MPRVSISESWFLFISATVSVDERTVDTEEESEEESESCTCSPVRKVKLQEEDRKKINVGAKPKKAVKRRKNVEEVSLIVDVFILYSDAKKIWAVLKC